MLNSLPTGTVAFLFTDIEGSTRLWEANPEAMNAALALHDEIMRASIEANGGYVFKTMGDAFCAAFHTASDAAHAALDAQQTLFAEPWQIEPPVRARMALHAGAAEERGGDYFGQSLNRVARLLSAGHGGQTLVSAAAQELVRDALPTGCTLADLGDASLKDLTRPERVYQLNQPDLPFEFPPLKTLNSGELPNNLPQQPTSFIGREQEIADIKALLLKCRLLTLVGPGGAGKTRLALQAAADLLDGEGDGVWLVELAPLSEPNLVAGAVAQALGVKEQGGDSIAKTLVEALKAKSLLIVLDNCEHVLTACRSLATDILRSCPKVHLLATSREPLGAPGEQLYRIPSLSTPVQASGKGGNQEYTAESLSQYESVRLFIERAKTVQPSFAVTDANAPAVAQLCVHLDGIPLAIELAAARVRSMAVEQVNARLDSRFKLLTGGSPMSLPRHQTLKALIDWSYDLLTEQEKAMLRQLSVFAGGWTLEAAGQVCAGHGTELQEWEAFDLLMSLTDKSLVVYDEAKGVSASRYRLLESIRQYGQERLAESEKGEARKAHTRHLSWCVSLAEGAAPQLIGQEQAVWMARLETEHDNIRAALSWCWLSPDAPNQKAALRLTGALWRFWELRGFLSEGRKWLERSLNGAEGRTTDLLHLRANSLNGAGNLAMLEGHYAASRALHQACLKIRHKIQDRKGIASSLNGLGNISLMEGEYAAARTLYHESCATSREIQDWWGIASSLNNQALAASYQGELLAARTLLQESLDICRNVGDKRLMASALGNMGEVATAQGDYASARTLLREGMEIFRDSGSRNYQMADVIRGIADLASAQGQSTRALRLWGAEAALRENTSMALSQKDIQERSSKLAAARKTIGDDSVSDAAWSSGQAMDWEQATEFALSEDD